ncbi:hypothetical protein NMY22_g7956 [Coprinellus aureogranulatus]|nr:hypothetical protein NMY22_g7956 [Coprinellus aureogranulatus]
MDHCDAPTPQGDQGDESHPSSALAFLPTEVISLIFLSCLEVFKVAPPTRHRYHPIAALSHTSREWRELALAMPVLWSVIDIDPAPPPTTVGSVEHIRQQIEAWAPRPMSALAQRTDIFLSRSAECVIAVRIATPGVRGTEAYNIFLPLVYSLLEPIVKAVVAHSTRWQELTVNLDGNWLQPLSPFLLLAELQPYEIPQLSKYSDVYWDASRNSGFHNLNDLSILLTPSLRRLKLKTFRSAGYTSDPPVSWSSLTELEIGNVSYTRYSLHGSGFIRQDEMSIVLRLCPNLIHCSLHLKEELTEDDVPVGIIGPVELPWLQSINLTGSWVTYGMASQFHLPGLTSLSILPFCASRSNQSSLVEWGLEFGPQLTEFAFSHDALSRRNLLRLLQNMPKLTVLTQLRTRYKPIVVTDQGKEPVASFDQDIWRKLTPNVDSVSDNVVEGCLCPNLEVLHCVLPTQLPNDIPDFEEVLISFITTRQRNSIFSGHMRSIKERRLAFPGQAIPATRLDGLLRYRGVNTNLFLLDTVSCEQVWTHRIA